MFLILVIAATVTVLISGTSGKTDIGSLYQCAHDLRGKVWVVNDRELLIEGFNYDGKGPAAWFHGQLRPASGVSNSDPSNYVTLPYPGGNCDRLIPGVSYKNVDVTLILPRSVKEFETIGVFCYKFCHNFGHVVIPKDLVVPEAPEHLVGVECPKPDYSKCSSVKRGELNPDCPAGAMPKTRVLGGRWTFIFKWAAFSLFLYFAKI